MVTSLENPMTNLGSKSPIGRCTPLVSTPSIWDGECPSWMNPWPKWSLNARPGVKAGTGRLSTTAHGYAKDS